MNMKISMRIACKGADRRALTQRSTSYTCYKLMRIRITAFLFFLLFDVFGEVFLWGARNFTGLGNCVYAGTRVRSPNSRGLCAPRAIERVCACIVGQRVVCMYIRAGTRSIIRA